MPPLVPSSRPRTAALVVAALASAAVAYVGFRSFHFLCDDAYIAFRYAENAADGFGLVWNRPPFAPVEGYSSFAWVVLLAVARGVFDLAPPEVAPWLSFACMLGAMGLVGRAALRMPLPASHASVRGALAALVVAGMVGNRTLLVFSSSGLETGLFVLAVVGWVLESLRPEATRSAWHGTLLASLVYLVRPDGLLFVAASVVDVAVRGRDAGSPRRFVGQGLAPVALVAAHLAFRWGTYGVLLPNTYYAKVNDPWPEAGGHYLAAFVLEYGLASWVVLALVAARRAWVDRGPGGVAGALRARWGAIVACSTLALHAAYYTFRIGGDHFEFRVYAHVVPFVFLSAASFAAWTTRTPAIAPLVLSLVVGLSLPIPWADHLDDAGPGPSGAYDGTGVADNLPAVLVPVAEAWQRQLAWLTVRGVGVRRAQHHAVLAYLRDTTPVRDEGRRVPWAAGHSMAARSVGYRGWALPGLAILDYHGLNDPVVAHYGPRADGRRYMAHERRPPPGYFECLQPNAETVGGRLRVHRRAVATVDVAGCERRFDPRHVLRRSP